MEWLPPSPSQQPADLPPPTSLSYGAATQTSGEGQKKKGGSPAWLIGVMLVSLAAVLAVVLLTRGGDDDSSAESTVPSTTSVEVTVAETEPPTTEPRVTTPPPTIALIVETTVPPDTTVLAETTIASEITVADPSAPSTTLLGAVSGGLAADVNVAIAAADGTHLVSSGGELNVLRVPSVVSFQTIDGGFIFQGQTGRGDSSEATHIRRVVGGAEAVIVAAESGEFLRLHDVSRGDGNDIIVLYSRIEGSSPEDSQEGLYLLDLLSGNTSYVGVIGGWESGTSMLDLAGDLIVGEASAEVSTAPFAIDRRGNAVDISTAVGLQNNYVDCAECPHHFSVDPTGSTLAWGENGSLVIVDRSGANPPLKVPVPGFVDGFGLELSIRNGVVIINRPGAASLVVDTRSGAAQVTELPLIGHATFAG